MALLADVLALLDDLEWSSNYQGSPQCPCCETEQYFDRYARHPVANPHAPDCALDVMRRRIRAAAVEPVAPDDERGAAPTPPAEP